MPSRARRHQLNGTLVFHAYNRSNNRIPIFTRNEDFRHFIGLLKNYRDRFYLKIYHWSLMHTHFHLLLELADPREISRLMSGINRAYTHYHHKVHGTSGLLWQGRFGLQPIQKEPYLKACGRYIERNPVRANIIQNAWEYQFSSARFYCLGFNDGVTHENPLFARYGATISLRRSHYTEYLRDFSAEEEGLFRNDPQPVGDEHFIRRLRFIDGRYLPVGRGHPRGTNRVITSYGG